jgi:spermidine synthase
MKDSDPDKHKWFQDHINPHLTMLHSIKEVLYSGQSKFQSIDIINTGSFGICLVLDGKIQSSESDEFIYHEALVHPVMLAHPNPEKVFIAGGGEGATLREVLAHKTVKKVTMVDIDEEVVNVCRQFLPSFCQNSFDDPRAELHFTDARRYLEENDDKFDVIIIDLPDPLEGGPARLLYTQEFYHIVKQRLHSGGIISVQAESAGWTDLENFTAIIHTLRTIFSIVCPYSTYMPSFTDVWGFASASESLDPSSFPIEEIDRRISVRIAKELKSYDGLTHQAMFIIPKHVRQQLTAAKKIITDKQLIFAYWNRYWAIVA